MTALGGHGCWEGELRVVQLFGWEGPGQRRLGVRQRVGNHALNFLMARLKFGVLV